MLNDEQTGEYLKKAKAGDNAAKETLISENVSLIKCIVKRYLNKGVKVSRAIKQTAKEINGYVAEFSVKNGRKPALSEIAAAFSMEESEVVFMMGSSRMPLSLQSESNEGEEGGRTLMETLASGEGEEEMLDKLLLKTAMETLSERDRKIIFLRYFRDMTQSEVAETVGVSQVQISRIESRILRDFKDRFSS